MSESLDASSSTAPAAASSVQDGPSQGVNGTHGTNGNDGPSKPRARLGPVETVTLQEYDPDSDSEDEEEQGEAHIEDIEPQSEDFLKDHPDDTDVCQLVKRRIEELTSRIYIFNIFDLPTLPYPHLNYLGSSSSNDYV